MVYESWVDRQVREAIERGEFDNLPGAGKPLHLDDDPDWWLKAKIAREQLEPLLPTPLVLRREVERLPETLAGVRGEHEVRAIVDDLNARIKQSYLQASIVRVVVGLVDVEAAVETWRGRRRGQ